MGGYATNPDTNSASEITGSGTANYMAKFTAAQVIGNSTVQDDGTTVSTTSLFRVGNPAAPGGSLSQMRVGKGTAIIDFGEVAASSSAIWFQRATPTTNNYAIYGDAATTIVNGSDNVILYASAVERLRINRAQTSGTTSALVFTGAADTGMTASTEIPKILFTLGSRQWATGAITTQREVYITSPTYSFVGASTISTAYTLYVEAPTASTNATINSSYALGLSGSMAFVGGNASIVGSNAITIQSSAGSSIILNAGSTTSGGINVAGQGTQRMFLYTSSASSGAQNFLTYTPSSNTGQTASTEINGYLYNSYTRTWAAGAITTQREHYLKTVTYAFASASTITSAYAMYIEAATAGTNATITNNYAAGFSGAVHVGALTSGQRLLTVAQDTAWLSFGSLVGATSYGAIYINQATPSASNYTLLADSSGIIALNSPAANGPLDLRVDGNNAVRFDPWQASFTPRTRNTAAMVAFKITQAANTGQTASTEIPGFYFLGASRQWSTGAITTQRETYFSTTTYTAVGASVITNAYGMYVEAPTASTNITITNNWALGLSGALYVNSANSSIFDNSAGSNTLRIQRSSGAVETIITSNSTGSFIGSSTSHPTAIQSAGVTRFSFAGSGTGDCTVTDTLNFVFSTGTGTKIGTATTQKIGFWNATPIVQPTTAVTAATFVANTSGIVNDTATFDGYTIGQVVKALRNEGLLA